MANITPQFRNIDLSKKPQDLKMWVAKPDKTIVGVLHATAYNVQLDLKLGDVSTLQFNLPWHYDKHGQQIQNPIANILKERFLIKTMNGSVEMWWMIDKLTDEDENQDESRLVNAYSLEYELKDKMVRNFQYGSLSIQQCLQGGTTSLNGTTQNIPDLLGETLWSVGYVDGEFATMFRSMDISSTTVLDYINSVAQTFNAEVEFDTVNRVINFYNPLDMGIDKGFSVRFKHYMQYVSNEYDQEEMATRLRCFGQNGLTFSGINPTGQDYIEDLSYFKFPYEEDEQGNAINHSYYMSDELCHAELAYKAKVESYGNQMANLVSQLSSLQSTLTSQQNVLDGYNTDMNVLKDTLAEDKAQGKDLTTDNQNIADKQTQIDNQNAAISSTNSQITDVQNQINAIGQDLAMEKNFSTALIEERSLYIIEKEWSDSSYSDAQSLYTDAQKQFKDMKMPKTTVQVSMVNFLQMVEFQRDWDKLNLGDLVTIKHDRMAIDIQAKIMEAQIDYERGTITLTVTNTKDLSSDAKKLAKMLNNFAYSSTTVDMSKYKWDLAPSVQSQVDQIINNTWDAVKNAITAGANECVTIDKRGITITDPTNTSNWLIANAGVLAITNDGGNTWKNAITANGIVGERIFGQLIAGVNLTIDASDSNGTKTFTVDSNGVTLNGASLTITGGLPKSQLDSTFVNGLVNLGVAYNGVVINQSTGMTMTGYDINNNPITQITVNAGTGIAIAKNTGTSASPVWTNQFYTDGSGNVVANGITTSNIKIQMGSSTPVTLLDASTGTIDFTKFTVINPSAGLLKGISVTNSSGATSFSVDANGNVTIAGNITMNSGSITWGTGGVNAPSASQVGAVSNNQTAVFNALTNNGAVQGMTMSGGNLYFNASYINAGQISATYINTTNLAAQKISNPSSTNSYAVIGGTYGDIIAYWNNSEYFRVYNNADGSFDLNSYGSTFITARGSSVTFQGSVQFTGSVTGLPAATFG